MVEAQWLEFDNEQFEESVAVSTNQDSNFYGFLNVAVTNDNSGGNDEKTVITFDTDGHGGSPIEILAEEYSEVVRFNTGKLQITLYGGMEAGSFFSALKNLVTCYEQRVKIGL
jgi:hypothetical protein